MKKFLAFLLSVVMCLSTSSIAFASESAPVVADSFGVVENDADVSREPTRDMVYYISYYQDYQMCDSKVSSNFTVSSGYNLKLIMASAQTVKVYLYNVNTGIYQTLDNGKKYVTVTGGASASTINFKASCPSGTYRLEFHTSYSTTFYAIYSVVGTTYV